MSLIKDINQSGEPKSSVFYSLRHDQEQSNSFHSLDDDLNEKIDTTSINVEMQIVNNCQSQDSPISTQASQEAQQSLIQLRLLGREVKDQKPSFKKEIVPINITFLYLEYIKNNPGMKIWLMSNILLDICLRILILVFFCIGTVDEDKLIDPTKDKTVTAYFIIFLQIPRILHLLTTSKLIFMDKYNLQNRSYLPMSYVFRANFIKEVCPRQEDLKPINYKDNILSIRSMMFILLPIELQWIPMYPFRNRENSETTIIISSYILKSIEVMIFEPTLLIIISFKSEKLLLYTRLLFGLILLDIIKFVILNLCLIIFSNVGKNSKVKI
ncbi:unnamed protein product (macronuclear) [Paramecium tetraurelia]|uniref:Ion transport domain-containing protein n=1 Tax=Paramecium tetraurelia TaxID=5888 RepID=A0DBN3_PARTE|nr:uncharacterized protein GSPATT00015347001 [Paramecium tetraurelia]CAK80450.1 unnamed protein product [Paramecium tetraurelia]|eukprot:XP_001447847.1 hypothetical protein (macronuclear) [Paramecium tetraurelia strain d4-2]